MKMTKAQRRLHLLHGSVEDFTDQLILAIGRNLKPADALKMIREYRTTWSKAAGVRAPRVKAPLTAESQ